MLELFRAGGAVMWFVLLFGGATLVTSILFARAPDDRRLGILRALTACTAFTTIGGVAAAISATMYHVTGRPEWAQSDELHLIVMLGIGESMTPAVLGFSLLGLAWLVTAIGVRRS